MKQSNGKHRQGCLTQKNTTKNKTKHINHESFEMRKYLSNNINTYLTKTIFSVRAGTIDLKCLNEWKYEYDKCVIVRLRLCSNFHRFWRWHVCREFLAMRLGFSSFIEFQTGVAVSFTNAQNAVTTVAAITVSQYQFRSESIQIYLNFFLEPP